MQDLLTVLFVVLAVSAIGGVGVFGPRPIIAALLLWLVIAILVRIVWRFL